MVVNKLLRRLKHSLEKYYPNILFIFLGGTISFTIYKIICVSNGVKMLYIMKSYCIYHYQNVQGPPTLSLHYLTLTPSLEDHIRHQGIELHSSQVIMCKAYASPLAPSLWPHCSVLYFLLFCFSTYYRLVILSGIHLCPYDLF